MTPKRAVIALGANLGDPARTVGEAFGEIAALPGTRLLVRSSLYRTAPVGLVDQPAFVNACALVETSLAPRALLAALLAIEQRHGRVREVPNGPRTLDLDIVLHGDSALHEPGLTVPHPRAHERAFVLVPLLEVWPEASLPGRGAAASFRAAVAGQAIEKLAPAP